MSEPGDLEKTEPTKPDPEAVARALAASAPHEPTGDFLNLSQRPFRNNRPVVRAALLLWLGGAILLAINVSSFWDYLSGSADKRAQIAKGAEDLARRETAVRQLEVRLDSYDLGANNEKVDFLNEKIAQRTFSWSLLLERIGEVLPNDVRLNQLEPASEAKPGNRSARSRRRPQDAPEGSIPLAITGQSRSFEALLRLQSNLFAHPAFGSYPNVSTQTRNDEDNLITFDLSALYVPGKPPATSVRTSDATSTPKVAPEAPGGGPMKAPASGGER